VWNANRNIKKALVVGTYEEFLRKGREKLLLGGGEPLRVVLETDGTQVEDAEYFHTLPENTIFIVLRSGEAWTPAGQDIVSQVVSTIPKIVCETLAALGLEEEIPSWKIMDNKGKITVVLHWEKEHPPGQPPNLQVGLPSSGLSRGPSRQSSTSSTLAGGSSRLLHPRSRSSVPSTPALSRDNSRNSSTDPRHLQGIGGVVDGNYTILNKEGKREPVNHEVYKKCVVGQAPQVTVINADSEVAAGQQHGGGGPAIKGGNLLGCRSIISGAPSPRQLSRQGSSLESSALHTHTVECAGGARLHQPLTSHSRGSPTSNECDFHCCSLHAGHSTHKNVATSPIQVSVEDGRRTLPKGAHVRFDVETRGSHTKCDAIIQMGGDENGADSSESDGEGGEGEEGVTTTKFLLLVDQLSLDQKHHLSIKDIGIILDRLSSKILDVEKLDREKEESDVYNWTIKATIRGEVMRELGVIYNSNYYSISEHPAYLPDPLSPDNEDIGD